MTIFFVDFSCNGCEVRLLSKHFCLIQLFFSKIKFLYYLLTQYVVRCPNFEIWVSRSLENVCLIHFLTSKAILSIADKNNFSPWILWFGEKVHEIPSHKSMHKSTFTWDPKWTQTSLKSQNALKCLSVYMAIYMEISKRQLSKQ